MKNTMTTISLSEYYLALATLDDTPIKGITEGRSLPTYPTQDTKILDFLEKKYQRDVSDESFSLRTEVLRMMQDEQE